MVAVDVIGAWSGSPPHIDDRIAAALDDARHDRRHPAGQANVEVGSACSELMLARLGGVGDAQTELALGIGRPGSPVFRAECAATRTGRDRRLPLRPVQREADVGAVTASENDPCGSIAHGRARQVISCDDTITSADERH
jgi:hypothetical protein